MTTYTVPDGFKLVHYQQEESGHLISIMPMVHIGPAEFYEKRHAEMEELHKLGYSIHHEGANTFPMDPNLYHEVAAELGVAAQVKPNLPHQIIDMDWSELNKLEQLRFRATMGVLTKAMKHGVKNMTPEEKADLLVQLETLGDSKPNPLTKLILGSKLTKGRSYVAITAALAAKGSVLLVWGQAHLQDFVPVLLAKGYKPIIHPKFLSSNTKDAS